MPKGPAARILDPVLHPLPPVLQPGPGSMNVLIGKKPAWRGIGGAGGAAFQAAKKISDAAIEVLEKATIAAAPTPGAAVAKTAEETGKTAAATAMGTLASSLAAVPSPKGGFPDTHVCATPLPIPPHGPGFVIDGSKTVMINGLPACRQGDTVLEALGPPNKIAMGLPTVIIGG